jgi:hypothetical protein
VAGAWGGAKLGGGGIGAGWAMRGRVGDTDGDDGGSYDGQARARRGEQRRIDFFLKCGRGTVWHVGRDDVGAGMKSSQMSVTIRYIRRLTDEYTITHIYRLTDECTGLSLSVHATFLGAGTEEYSPVIFLGTKKYKVTEEYNLFSCSGRR